MGKPNYTKKEKKNALCIHILHIHLAKHTVHIFIVSQD